MKKQKSILEMARGALLERADYELNRIIDNIMDPNTPATKKRKLVVSIELAPDENRTMIAIAASAKSTLAVTTPISSVFSVCADKDGVPTIKEMVVDDAPEQEILPAVTDMAQPVIAVLSSAEKQQTQAQ